MRIDFDDEEYPELSRYLENPKRKMKFLYFLEELFTNNGFDPVIDGLEVLANNNRRGHNTDKSDDLYQMLAGITAAIDGLSKNMEGSVIGRFPTEHVVHEVAAPAPVEKKQVDLDETDYSSTEGIDFTASLAMFED